MSKFSTEVVRRVFDDSDGVYIEVGPDSDGLDLIQVSTSGESEEYYGKLRLILAPEQARHLAKALLAAADESKSDKVPAK
jgi:hypothetical protein